MSFVDSIAKDIVAQRKSRSYTLLSAPFKVKLTSQVTRNESKYYYVMTCKARNKVEAEIKFTMWAGIDPTTLLGSWDLEEMKLIKRINSR
jgi:hypothetical protein